jgi:hypothetical protein
MVQYFYASNLCPMKELIYIWDTCFNKHEAIKKIIFQLWIDVAEYVSKEDWMPFTDVLMRN